MKSTKAKNIFHIPYSTKAMVFALLLLLSAPVRAQISSPNNFLWVKGGGSHTNGFNTEEKIDYMAVDAHKNVYAMATVEGFNGSNIKLDSFSKTNGYGYDDFLVFSYNCEGKLRWVKHFGSSTIDRPGGLTVDDSGNVYVCGVVPVTKTTASHYGDTVIPATQGFLQDVFVMKMDSLGNIKWFRIMGQGQSISIWAIPRGIEIDAQGTLHMFTWFFTLGAVWDGFSPTQKSWNVVKLNSSNGMVTGITKLQMGDKFGPNPFPLTMDDANNYYMSCQVDGGDTIIINGNTILQDTFNAKHILIKFSPSGNVLWHYIKNVKITPSNLAYAGFGLKPIVDSGYIYLTTIVVADTGTVFGFFLTNPLASLPGYGLNAAPGVVKIDAATGQGVWATTIKTLKPNAGGMPGLLKNGNIAFAGAGGQVCIINANDTIKPVASSAFYMMYPYVVIMDAQTGYCISGEGVPSDGINNNMGSVISDGTPSGLYFAGRFTQKLFTDNKADSLVSQGGNDDFFIARYAPPNSCDCPPVAPKAKPQMVGAQNTVVTVKAGAVSGADSLIWNWGDGSSTKDPSPGSNLMHTYATPGSYNICLKTYSACGMENSCLNAIVTSVGDTELPELMVYPNPVNGMLTVENPYSTKAQAILIDMKGSVVFTQFLPAQRSTVDMSSVTPGVYMLFIRLEDGRRAVKKIVRSNGD